MSETEDIAPGDQGLAAPPVSPMKTNPRLVEFVEMGHVLIVIFLIVPPDEMNAILIMTAPQFFLLVESVKMDGVLITLRFHHAPPAETNAMMTEAAQLPPVENALTLVVFASKIVNRVMVKLCLLLAGVIVLNLKLAVTQQELLAVAPKQAVFVWKVQTVNPATASLSPNKAGATVVKSAVNPME